MPTRRPGAGGRVPPHYQAEVVAQSLWNWGRPEPDGGDGQRRPATTSGRLARLKQPEGWKQSLAAASAPLLAA